jgi:D-tyrosyl-tRNA(Tyr) deacylase
MRAVVSRVTRARVLVDGEVVGKIGPGLSVLVGVTHADTAADADWLARKIANLRVFDDDEGRPNRSVLDAGGEVLVVSQFTLYGDASAGRRPSYIDAARPEQAEPLVAEAASRLEALGAQVATGRFRAYMLVEQTGDGPFTILLDSVSGRRR